MEPTEKSQMLDDFITETTGIDRKATIRGNACVFCTMPNLKFKDDASEREYCISGICQDCQDQVFKENDDE